MAVYLRRSWSQTAHEVAEVVGNFADASRTPRGDRGRPGRHDLGVQQSAFEKVPFSAALFKATEQTNKQSVTEAGLG